MTPTFTHVLSLLTFVLAANAEPPELKQHRDAKSKQDLKTYLDRQDTNLEWRLKHFDKNHDGTLDRKELAQLLSRPRPLSLPLPKGEGRGEGKGSITIQPV